MENTIENKEKFIAQYWGQNIVACYNWPLNSDFFTDFIGNPSYNYIMLKPLSSITDEDAIEIAKIITAGEIGWTISNPIENDRIELSKANDELVIWYDGEFLFDNDFNNQLPLQRLSAYDYLRSRGYALPWMGLSVEKQLEYGWIKLIEK